MKSLKVLVLMVCLLASQFASALASSDRIVVFGTSVLPVSSIWWNETRSGSGYNLAIDEKGFIFLTWFSYRRDGTPTFYVMSGQFVTPCGNATAVSKGCLAQKLEWSRTGIIGRLNSPIYETANGACPTCVYQPNTVSTSALGAGEVVFYGNRVADLKFGTTTIKIYPQPLIATIDDQLKGTWTGKNAGSGLNSEIVTIRDSGSIRFIRASELDGLLRPLPDMNLSNQSYQPLVLSNRTKVFRLVGGGALVAVEPNGRIYLVSRTSVGPEFEYDYASEIFVDGNRMVFWGKDSYKPNFGSTVGMTYEMDLYRSVAFPAGAEGVIVR